MSAAAPLVPAAASWHDAECGGYAADLPLWERLAAEQGGPVLDLGAGTGRVALHLAARGHRVVAVELDPALAEELARRAHEEALAGEVEVVCADVRELALAERFPLAVAPMQLLHMLGGAAGRRHALAAIRAHLAPGGRFAAALLAEPLPSSGRSEPLPDIREVGGWVYASLPLEVRVGSGELEIVRLRQLVAPGGDLSEEVHRLTVDRLPPGVLEGEARAAGLAVVGEEPIAETDEHVGSLALLMEGSDRG